MFVPSSRRYFLTLSAVFLLAGGFIIGYIVGQSTAQAPTSPNRADFVGAEILNKDVGADISTSSVDFQLFWEAWSLIQREYLRQPVTNQKLFYGALGGLVNGLGDPYSTFFDPERARLFRQDLAGRLEGIGAELGIKQKQLTIIAPLPSSPAERAGLRSGDVILAIDGKIATDMTLEEAVSLIRGPKGSTVELLIFSKRQAISRKISVVRDVIQVASVHLDSQKTPQSATAAVISISHFNEDSVLRFDDAAREILLGQHKGIVLDLRNNPGGFLETAIAIGGEWIENNVVTRERNWDGVVSEHRSSGLSRLRGLPTVVLVNQGTASAAEIVAGALQDHGLAIIVGEQTFGKGTVQHLTGLRDGSAIKLTTAEWLTPKGRSIEGGGITPDIAVSSEEADYNNEGEDIQLKRALQALDEQIMDITL